MTGCWGKGDLEPDSAIWRLNRPGGIQSSLALFRRVNRKIVSELGGGRASVFEDGGRLRNRTVEE